MNKEEYKTIEFKIPKLNDLEIKRDINDSLYCIKEINELVIKDKQEQYIRELLNRIHKAIEYIKTHKRQDDFLELNEWGTRDLLEILGGKE